MRQRTTLQLILTVVINNAADNQQLMLVALLLHLFTVVLHMVGLLSSIIFLYP